VAAPVVLVGEVRGGIAGRLGPALDPLAAGDQAERSANPMT
jgi:hypothetical protein